LIKHVHTIPLQPMAFTLRSRILIRRTNEPNHRGFNTVKELESASVGIGLYDMTRWCSAYIFRLISSLQGRLLGCRRTSVTLHRHQCFYFCHSCIQYFKKRQSYEAAG